MNRRVLYPSGMLGIIIVCILLAVLGADAPLPYFPASDHGIAFPSPAVWPIIPTWGSVVNAALLFLCAVSFFFLNKRFSLLRTDQPLGAAFLLPLCFSNILLGGRWTAAPVVLLMTFLVLTCLFDSYRARNATQRMFLIATFLSIGSMFEYAFIPLALAAFLGSLVMEAMRPKEFLAMGMGLIAPYWIAIGLGLVNPLELRLPRPVPVFMAHLSPGMFISLVSSAALAVAALILTLYNGMILYAGNTRVRRSVLTINIFGITSMAAIFFDATNIPAYLGVFYLWVATQLANLFSLREMRRGMLTFWLIQMAIYSISLLFMIGLMQ